MINLALEILNNEYDPSEAELVDILTAASDEYYNESDSFLTDAQYDTLEQLLKSINPKSLYLAEVGSAVRGGKVTLPYPMGSLDQLDNGVEATQKWIKSNGWDNHTFVVSDKQDGTSGMIIYGKGGAFTKAYSRGNGVQGADITRHVTKMSAVPKTMPKPCAIRVEFIMEEATFETENKRAAENNERVYANARNYVAGRMNAEVSPKWFYDNVKVIATSVEEPKMAKVDQMMFLKDHYQVTPWGAFPGDKLTDTALETYIEERRKHSPTAIDGIVIDIHQLDIRESLTRKSSSLNPMYAKKFKPAAFSNDAEVEVVAVHWEASKTGTLKPRIEIKPVSLVGVTIQYATGFNAGFIRDNKIGPGTKGRLKRSGDVIPYLHTITQGTAAALPDSKVFGEWEWNGSGVDAVLINPELNSDVQINILIDFFKQLDVPHIREGSITKLYDAGFTTPASIIKATDGELKLWVGESAGEKIYLGIKAKLNPVHPAILAGSSQLLGKGIGRRKMMKIYEAFGNLDNIHYANIVTVEGFEHKTAIVLDKNWSKYQDFLKEIDGYYTFDQPKEKVMGDLQGVVALFTGIRSKDLERKIEERGGSVAGSYSKSVNVLVALDPNGSSGKLKKARDAGVEIISLEEAENRWG